ncbi:GAMETOPHYTE DEFECTIVE 1-like protein, partial [Drosera capensis]
RPLNETVFEQACQSSEVDLISIDFSDKLRFRLKLPAIKVALARGVFFEICYSPLLEDAHLRGYLIPNVKYLVSWTRGKNLIVSSCAASVLGLRGPADVSNLLFLLGLPLQHAKAAVSKNCRSMITSALKKKQFFKEAIRVEPKPSQCHPSSQEPWIIDWMKWDPISSGEGDLLLDDIAKSFSDVDKCTKTAKALKPTSISARKTSSSLQYMDFTSKIGDLSHKAGDLREEQEVALPQQKVATLFHTTHLNSQPNELDVTKRTFPRDSSKAFLDVSDIGTSLTSSQKLECAGLVTDKSDVGVHSQLEDATSISLAGMLLEESLKNASITGDKLYMRHTASTSADVPDMWEDLDPHNSHVGGSTGIEVNDGSNYSVISLDLAFRDVMEREGFQESDVQADGMMPVNDDLIILSSDADDDDLIVLSPPTDCKIDDNGRMDSVTQGSMNTKVASHTNSIDTSASAEVSAQADILEGEHRPEFEIKAAMQADRIIHTDTSVDGRFGCSKSLNSDFVKEVVKTKKRKRNHMKQKTRASSASVSCGDAEFDHGKMKRGVDDDRSVMQALLPEEDMLRGSILMKCTKANRLSSCQTKPEKGKSRRWVPRQVLPSPSKHLFRVSFKKNAASANARKS